MAHPFFPKGLKKAYLSEVLFEGVFSVANASEPRPKDEEEEEEEDGTELRSELECWAAAASVAAEEVILGRAYLLPPSRFESRDFFFLPLPSFVPNRGTSCLSLEWLVVVPPQRRLLSFSPLSLYPSTTSTVN